ncbi:5624_t:CDS:2, partial [Scutellospora calospora]
YNEIMQKDNEIMQKNAVIEQKEEDIQKQKQEIESLENQLEEATIFIIEEAQQLITKFSERIADHCKLTDEILTVILCKG